MLKNVHRLLVLPLFLLLFVSLAFAANIYVDVSCTYNGDGTTAACASSDGGAGAYNNLSDPLANATSNIIWVRRGSSDISISSTLSPTNDGTESSPIKIIGWPIQKQYTGQTVDGAISGKEKFAFYDDARTERDYYWCGAEIEFTSGANAGLKRKVIYFKYNQEGNSHYDFYLFPDLPNNIQAGDEYTITLETAYFSDRPQSGIDAGWDNDSYDRPEVDGGGGSFNLFDFTGDRYWEMANFVLANTSYRAIYNVPFHLKHIVIKDVTNSYNSIRYGIVRKLEDIYVVNCAGIGCNGIWENVHLNDSNSTNDGIGMAEGGKIILKNMSVGRVTKYDDGINFSSVSGSIEGENVFIDANTLVNIGYWHYHLPNDYCKISGWNGDPDKFHQWFVNGEIYNVDEDATIDPPSGATTYIKFVPNSYCNSIYPLKLSFNRRQAASAKTYTFKVYIPSDCTTLTTSDIYADVWYLDESSGTHRKEETHNISTANTNAWNDLSFSITPGQEGTVYIDIVLQKYESGCYIALDPKFSVE